MFLDMPKFGVAPTVPLYNSLMDGAFRSGNAQEALPLYQEMTRLGLCPHKFTNSIIVRGLCDQEKMQVADIFLDRVRKADANLKQLLIMHLLMNTA